MANNPFAALRGRSEANDLVSAKEPGDAITGETRAKQRLDLSYCIERVFLVTLDKDLDGLYSDRPKKAVFLEELFAALDNQEWLDFENMSQAMFERTLMGPEQLQRSLIGQSRSDQSNNEVLQARTFVYLTQCYVRASKENDKVSSDKCKEIIIENGSTCLRQPDLYLGQIEEIDSQLIHQFDELVMPSAESDVILEFTERVLNEVVSAEGLLSLCSLLHPLLTKLLQSFTRGMMGKLCADNDAFSSLKILKFFIRNQNLAEVLLAFSNTNLSSAIAYEKTLFGTILSSSCAPNVYSPASELFNEPSRMTQDDVNRADNQAYTNSEMIISYMYDLFYGLCKISARTKHLLLCWIGRLLDANKGRIKLASTMSIHGNVPRDECSDGLMLNLSAVLLKLCQPFSQPRSSKLLKIQPQYARQQHTEVNTQEKKQHHVLGLPEETFLVPLGDNEVTELENPEQFSFICDLYFLTQQALYYGMHAMHERFMNLNRELNRIQTAYQQIQNNPNAPNHDAIKFMFENSMKKYMGMRAALIDPRLLKPTLEFHIASATYLSYLATGGDNLKPFGAIKFPLTECNSQLLGCMPEYIVTNITDAMMITRRFKDSYFQDIIDKAGHLMDLILVFMGSNSRVKNPHLRAKLAEVLHEIMPKQNMALTMAMQTHEMLKERLFRNHPNIDNLADVLFHVFVSIEATGESVEFEQKLSYRQPMYKVLDYIWKIDLHRAAIQKLAEESLGKIEDTDPPLFLKFVNLLVNDANFLLDEALDFMKQIREKETERESRQPPLEGRELQQFEANLAHMTQLARFHNTAAVDTTHTLALLTSKCDKLFCHKIMVDRISAMLNYFLLKLTGPTMKEYKVQNFDKYEFKPSTVVSEICQIYINLCHSEEFCQAVSGDGRSYSDTLLPRAKNILIKISKPADMVQRFEDLSVKIQNSAVNQKEDDDLVASAPENYLDPIMGSLMREPVLLPSSQVIVDKSTIARHILSDQNDPFNRSPLALNMVIPQTELRDEIQQWIKDQKQN